MISLAFAVLLGAQPPQPSPPPPVQEAEVVWSQTDLPAARGVRGNVLVLAKLDFSTRTLDLRGLAADTGQEIWRFPPADGAGQPRYTTPMYIWDMGDDIAVRMTRIPPDDPTNMGTAGYLRLHSSDGALVGFLEDPIDAWDPAVGEAAMYWVLGRSTWRGHVVIVRWDGAAQTEWDLGETLSRGRNSIQTIQPPNLVPQAGGKVLLRFPMGYALLDAEGQPEWVFPLTDRFPLGETRQFVYMLDARGRLNVLNLEDGRETRGETVFEGYGRTNSFSMLTTVSGGRGETLVGSYELSPGDRGVIWCSSRGQEITRLREIPVWTRAVGPYLVMDMEGLSRRRMWYEAATGHEVWENEADFSSNSGDWPTPRFGVLSTGEIAWLERGTTTPDAPARVTLAVHPARRGNVDRTPLEIPNPLVTMFDGDTIVEVDSDGVAWGIDPAVRAPVWRAALSDEQKQALRDIQDPPVFLRSGDFGILSRGRLAIGFHLPPPPQGGPQRPNRER